MKFREKLNQEHPEFVGAVFGAGCCGCPMDYGYESMQPGLCESGISNQCRICWDREMEEDE